MKRSFVFAVAFLSMVYSDAQIVNSIGFKSGISLANQTWYYKTYNLPVHKGVRVGAYAGISLEFLKGKYLSLATDLAYVEKGNVERLPSSPTSNSQFESLNTCFAYFSVSPMLKVRYEFKRVVPYVLLGLRMDQHLYYRTENEWDDIEKDINKTLWGFTTGVGVAWKLDPWAVSVEALGHRDMSWVVDSQPTPDNYDGILINNRAFILNVGLHYSFGRKGTMK
jgi:opacity protein-like surface antigen